MSENLPSHHNRQGILYMLSAVFIFCLVNAIAKDTIAQYPPVEVLFFRFLGALLPSWFLLSREGGFRNFTHHPYGTSLIAAMILVLDLFCLFMSFKFLPLADATTLSFSSIFFVTILAAIFLKEHLSLTRISVIICGFIGVIIIAKPSGNVSILGAIFSLIYALTDAIVLLFIRIMTRTHKSSILVFSFTFFATLITAVFLPFVWKTPTMIDLSKFMLLGIGGGLGQFFITQAYRYAPVTIVAPMAYSAILWSTFLGFLFWAEVPNVQFWIGGTLVILSGLYIIWHERR
ncbi:MAG: DMT family transporter [Candidatus Paracaedimonas acanthamoebae]|uniref:DMT family transporter n=1 Tax=Candidatus Paracaedimonas acanthamoebae TaxID=244581 RepID=A0A8J7PJ48_9PROT|nr:DMT family transporter [Candidatus Paracaedimonas acanthamoebae]